jgi:formamidopyrimidine-DNA glycosylase
MSGNLLLRAQGAPDEPFLRARFQLDGGGELRFIDLRKFGAMWLTDDPTPVLAGLGPEPLDGSLTDKSLRAILAKRSAPVKAVLLDQRAIAGVGNLYADEALHYAGIHPLRPASSISKAEAARLRQGIVRALEQGLRNLGSTVGHAAGEEVSLRDHVNLSGEPGANQEYLVAYGREGRPCRTCGAPIERLKLSNRSAHFCPSCQVLKRSNRRGSKLEVRGSSSPEARNDRPRGLTKPRPRTLPYTGATLSRPPRSMVMKGYQVDILIKPWEEGGYLVEVPALQGCWCVIRSRQSVAKALDEIRDVIRLAIDARRREGKALPQALRPAEHGAAPLRLRMTVGAP